MGSVHDAQGSIQLDFSNSQGWNLHTVEQVAQRCCGCHVVCLFLSFKSSLNICFSLCLSSTTPVRFGKIFLKGQKERTWRQLCCMSVGTQTCPCTPSVFYATDDKHKKFIPLLWAKRSPKLWQMLSPAQRNL